MTSQCKIKCFIYDSMDGSLYDEWKDLWLRSPYACMFNSPGWFRTACETFQYKHKKICVLRNTNTQKLVGVLPLVRERMYGLNAYVLPGGDFVDRYTALFDVKQKCVVQTLVEALKKIGVVYIAGLVEMDARSLIGQGCARYFFLDENPYIAYQQKRGEEGVCEKKSKTLKRAEKKYGSVTFSFVVSDHGSAIAHAIMIDQKSSKAKRGKCVFDKEVNRVFFNILAKECADHVFVALLYFAKEPVAYNIGFVSNGVYACSQKAHLLEYNEYRPGAVAFKKFVETVSLRSYREIDIGRGNDSFKMEYTKTIRSLYGVVISKHRMMRSYIIFALNLRKKIYHFVSERTSMYSHYKKIKNSMSAL